MIAVSVSTGFDVINGNATPERTAMNYVLAGTMAGKSWDKQMTIATTYEAFISGNDPNKSTEEFATDVMIKGGGVMASFGSSRVFRQIGLGKTGQIFFSESISNYVENHNNLHIDKESIK